MSSERKQYLWAAVPLIVGFALAVIAVLGSHASAADNGCQGHQHTLAGHMKWDDDLWRADDIPDWAVVKHRHYVACAKSPAHREAIKQRWKRIKASLLPENHDLWIRIGRCEQPGDGYMGVNWSFDGATYQGGLGIWAGNWDSLKPRGYPADAGQADWRQQMEVANRLAANYGFGAWGCYGL